MGYLDPGPVRRLISSWRKETNRGMASSCAKEPVDKSKKANK